MRAVAALCLGLALGCGRKAAPPAPPASLAGRWTSSDGKRILELLADGTLVDWIELEAQRSTRLPDGTFRTATAHVHTCYLGSFRSLGPGRLAYELTRVGDGVTREGTGSLDAAQGTLTLTEEGDSEAFTPADRAPPPGAQPLVGLWRRVGVGAADETDLGVRFTPGGLGIIVGKGAVWDERGTLGSAGWLCTFETYAVEGGGMLREVRPNEPERPRTRTFRVEGDRLMLGPTLVYERVHGVVPLRDGQLDVAAWRALE